MKIQVTALNPAKNFHMGIGQKVVIVHDPESKGFQYDPKVLSIFDEHMVQQLGNVGAKYGVTVIDGTQNNEALFDEMVKRKLQDDKGFMTIAGVVVGEGKVTFRDGSIRTAYIVEVALPAIPSTTQKTFVLTVRGSVKEYKGKTLVLKSLTDGKPMSLWLEKEGGQLITFLTNGNDKVKAGCVYEAISGDLEKLESYLEALSKRGVAQSVKAVAARGNAYEIEFCIDSQTFEDVLAGKVVKTLDEVKQEVISKGITDVDTIESIETYLTSNQVPTKHIKKIFETMRVYRDEVKARIPNPSVKYKDVEGLVKKTVVYLNKGKHLRFIGEKGVGKNVLIETLAWIYQRPLYEMALNSQTDKMDILGAKTFETELDANGKEVTKMSFDKEALVEAMEVGGFMNLDEINTADPSVLVVLHPIADGRRRLEVPGYGLVEADENFNLILSMNRDYLGTNPLNEATRDRFVPVVFPDNSSIAEMLSIRVPTADPKDITLADQVYVSIMKLIHDGQLTNDCITNRGFIDALEVAEDLGLQEALMDNVANRIEDEEYRNTVASIIDDIVG